MPDDIATRHGAAQHLRAALQPSTFNAEQRTVDVIFSTGADVPRQDYWTGQRWVERLEVSADAVDLSRLSAGAPVLNTHSSWSLGDVVGVVERAWVEGGKGYASLRFSERPEVADIVRDVAAGILRNISVGYSVEKWDVTEAGRGGAELRIAKRWTPMEVSLVPIPADLGAQVRARPETVAHGRGGLPSPPAAPAALKESDMADIDPAAEAATRAAEITAAREAAAVAERTRVAEIMTAARAAGLDADWAEKHIGDGTAADQVRKLALDEVAARATPRVPAEVAGARRDERDTMLVRMATALDARRRNAEMPEEAREFAPLGLHAMIRELAMRNGVKGVHRMSGDQLFGLVNSRAAGQTSSDFAAVLVNSTNKSLRSLYLGQPKTWAGWTNEIEVADFKTITSAGMGNFPEPQVLAENQSVPRGNLQDEGETYNVSERSIALNLSRVAIVNDDLRSFDRAISNAALGGYTALRRAVFGVLTSNPTMADSIALFNASHTNLGTAGALTATTFGELRRLLLAQVDTNNQPLPPPTSMVLLCGPNKERTALELTTSLIVPTAAGSALPQMYRTMTQVIMDPFINTGNEPYYLARTDVPAVEIAYLQGGTTPTVISDADIDYTGVTYRLDFPFGVKAVTWRSIAANLG